MIEVDCFEKRNKKGRIPIREIVRGSGKWLTRFANLFVFFALAMGLARSWSFCSVVGRVTSLLQNSTFLMLARDSFLVCGVVVVVVIVLQSY